MKPRCISALLRPTLLVVAFAFCLLFVTALATWADKAGDEIDVNQHTTDSSDRHGSKRAKSASDSGTSNDPSSDDAYNKIDEAARPGSQTASSPSSDGFSSQPVGAVGTTFQVKIKVGTNPNVPCTFMVTDAVRHCVQVGTGKGEYAVYYEKAIPDGSSGSFTLPSYVTNGGIKYSVTSIGDWAFYECFHITSTGIAGNTTIKWIGYAAYGGDHALRTTGLESNSSVTVLKDGVFGDILGLESTGLASNTTLTTIGRGVFWLCPKLTKTGLEHNWTVTNLGFDTFNQCHNLKSTGLESNSTLTKLDKWVFRGCSSLTKTGLEKNSKVTSVGIQTFQDCTSLASTGLDQNKTVAAIGQGAFQGCPLLGKAATSTSNAGDLVLNQPLSGKTRVALSVGAAAFTGTAYRSAYVLCDKGLFKPIGGFLDGAPVSKMYVAGSWLGTESFSSGTKTYRVVDGTLAVMVPLQGLSAQRKAGTADVANVTITTNQVATVRIMAGSLALADYRAAGDPGKAPRSFTFPTAARRGLTPAAQQLTAQVVSPSPFVYPAGAAARGYNTAAPQRSSCQLAASTYTVRFDPNNATGGTTAAEPMVYGQARKLTPNGFTWPYRAFSGWNAARAGTGAAYSDGQSVSNLTGVQGATVTLWAQWAPAVSMSLKVRSEDGASGAPLRNADFVLSRDRDISKEGSWVTGLFTDPGKKTAAGWPQSSDDSGSIALYGLPAGTFYLLVSGAPAGYQAPAAPVEIAVDADGRIAVDGAPYTPVTPDAISLAVAFGRAPRLPGTGTATSDGLRAVGLTAAALSAAVPVGLLLLGRVRRAG